MTGTSHVLGQHRRFGLKIYSDVRDLSHLITNTYSVLHVLHLSTSGTVSLLAVSVVSTQLKVKHGTGHDSKRISSRCLT